MTKNLKLLALVAVSAVMFVLPATASAGSPAVDPGAGLSFTGTFGTTTFETSGEPTFICGGENHAEGNFTSSTAGTLNLDYTNCHTFIFGITRTCKTAGAPVANTIKLNSLPFDTVYTTDNKTSPGLLLTNLNVTIECQSALAPITITGSIMGSITKPACGAKSKEATFRFTATSGSQEHKQITGTGTALDLLYRTGAGTEQTAALNEEFKVTFSSEATLTCV